MYKMELILHKKAMGKVVIVHVKLCQTISLTGTNPIYFNKYKQLELAQFCLFYGSPDYFIV